jgi:hypothetical protein
VGALRRTPSRSPERRCRLQAKAAAIAGRGSARRQRIFDRKGDAEAFEDEVRRRKRLDGLVRLDRGKIVLAELVEDYWRLHAVPNLATARRAALP